MKKKLMPILLALLLLLSFSSTVLAESAIEETSAIPVMTSNNAPSGLAIASESWSGTPAWKAFDNIKSYSTSYANYSAWGTTKTTGWLGYEFPDKKVISKYILYYGARTEHSDEANPKDWTFEGSMDGTNWTILDTQTNVTNWVHGEGKTYAFKNDTAFKMYRINVTANNGQINKIVNLTIHELAMVEAPEQPTPTGDRAILTVTMTTGLEKEYDLPMEEVNAFINWYDAKDAGSGPSKYAISKHDNNKGPFSKRTDYVIFNNILTFEVNEYTATSATYK